MAAANSALAPRAFHVYLFEGKARRANPQNVRRNVMGQTTQGIIVNTLTQKQIIELPSKLNGLGLFITDDHIWKWQDADMSENFLDPYWKRDQAWYHENLKIGNPDIYKDAVIWGPSMISIQFFEPKLISIHSGHKWGSFLYSADIKTKVVADITAVARILDASDIIFTGSFGSGETSQERNGHHYGSLDAMQTAFVQGGKQFEVVKLDTHSV